LGIHFLKQGHVIDLQGEEHSFIDRLVLGFYAYAMYLFKLILPYITCTYYPQPVSPKWYHYLISISGVLLIALTAINYKKNKQWTFAIAYFTIHIILLLQIVAAGSAFLADRFTYVASLGVVFISMYWVQHTIGNRPGLRLVFIALLLLFTVGYAVASVNYIKAWKDSDTIWSDVIEKYPRKVVVAYVNRGHYLRRQGQNDRAFADFNTAIELKKDYFLGYLNRGNIYFDRQENEKAMQDYMKCVQLKPNLDTTGVNRDAEAGNIYGNLGVIYGRLQLYDSSLYYLNIAIKSDPTKLNYYKNRALVYCEMRRYAESNTDFNKALEINPVDADIINAIGVNYLRAGENPKAKEQFDLAIQQNANSALFYLNRAFALQGMNKQQEALRDAIKAKELGLQVDPQFLNELGGNAGSR
jgi:tetratricopeptide (TPR) repeat protein